MTGDVEFAIRTATPADVPTVAHQRVAMFHDMGVTAPEMEASLREMTESHLRIAIPRGEYVGWLAFPASAPERIVAGAGVQVRQVLPFPRRRPTGAIAVAYGRQGIVLNVYTEPNHRRQGLARRLMNEVIAWARQAKLESLVLHAAPDGRPLYEQLGFVPTNEMRFMGEL